MTSVSVGAPPAPRRYPRPVIWALFLVFVVLFVVLPLIGMALASLIGTVVVGLIIGALARLVIPGSQPIGALATILCGWIGSIVGGFIGDRVIHAGHLATILLEIGAAALAVVAFSGYEGRHRPVARPR